MCNFEQFLGYHWFYVANSSFIDINHYIPEESFYIFSSSKSVGPFLIMSTMYTTFVHRGHTSFSESSGIVRPSSRLDYESLVDKFYILNISASDNGHPQFTTFTTLNISVTDFNDNQPEFTQKSYKVDVFENETVGVYFSNAITATDADTGDNGKVRSCESLSWLESLLCPVLISS